MAFITRRRESDRTRLWLACALFLVGWLTSTWHDANVQHERCADHGELIDVQPSSGCTDSGNGSLDGVGQRWINAHRNGGDQHDHCAFVTISSNPSVRADEVRMDLREVLAHATELAPACTWFGDGAQLILLAPKQSPPTLENSKV